MINKKTRQFLEMFDEKTKGIAPAEAYERALYILLKEHEDKLPELDNYFHKEFRQVDVINGATDMAIWNLLRCSRVFWECFSKIEEDKS